MAVLQERRRRFFDHLATSTVDELFDSLARWIETEGARGCLYLRALGDVGAIAPEVADEVAEYRRQLSSHLSQLMGHSSDQTLHKQLLILFEGATSAASYLGVDAIVAARTAAHRLLLTATHPSASTP